MKTLLLLRHAQAGGGSPGTGDFDRPLTEGGHKASALVGEHLAAAGCVPGAIISSPALRARQTAESALKALDHSELSFDERLYEASTETILKVIRSADSNAGILMLVGHNPSLQMAALKFCEGKNAPVPEALLSGFQPAGLIHFTFSATDWRDISWHGATFTEFLSPRKPGQ